MTPTFTYRLTPSIQFGCSLALNIGEELISICTEKRVLIISDSGVIAAGLADAVMASLKRKEFEVDLFDDLKGEASTAPIDAAAEVIRTARPGVVIGLGGGSALDVAKLATVLSAADRGAEYYALMKHPLPQRAVKLIMLPTTAGTGSEATRTAVFTNSDNRKVWAWGNELAADFVILDPELTLTLPQSMTATTGLDAMVHAIEACTAKNSHPLVQAFGLQAIRLGVQNLQNSWLEWPSTLPVRALPMRLDMPWGRLPAFIMAEPPHWRWTLYFLKMLKRRQTFIQRLPWHWAFKPTTRRSRCTQRWEQRLLVV
jgi:alcohol dehydrogenase class IV